MRAIEVRTVVVDRVFVFMFFLASAKFFIVPT